MIVDNRLIIQKAMDFLIFIILLVSCVQKYKKFS